MNKKYFTLLVLLFVLPTINAQSLIDINMDKFFLADEDIAFLVRLQNPNDEILESRLFVELISSEGNIKLAEESVLIYPRDYFFRTFREKLKAGNYKIRVELKDKFFDTVLDQRILEFNIAGSCTEFVCSLEEADRKCNCEKREEGLGGFLPVFFAVIAVGIILLLYFEIKRRRALG